MFKLMMVLLVMGMTRARILSSQNIPDVSKTCSDHSELQQNPLSDGECKEDMGPPLPIHGQTVYVESYRHRSEWYYPGTVWDSTDNYGYFMRKAKHSRKTITSNKNHIRITPITPWITDHNNTAEHNNTEGHFHLITTTEVSYGWIWHDCGQDKFCLESKRFKDYYLLVMPEVSLGWLMPESDLVFGLYVRYSAHPLYEKWTKHTINKTSKVEGRDGLFIKFDSDHIRYNLFQFFVYIPPRCVFWERVAHQGNALNEETSLEYTRRVGITKQSSKGDKVSEDLGLEIKTAIKAGAGASYTWQDTVGSSEERSWTAKVPVAPGRKVEIWQKVATYGPIYKWRSMTFFSCYRSYRSSSGSSSSSSIITINTIIIIVMVISIRI